MADPPLLVVVGPTGSGKSDLALTLAEEFSGEIVNCDSVQLYRRLDIGSAKTPVSKRRGVPHHLLDILDPDQHFTAGDYCRIARTVVQEIASRGRLPIVAGGTGFYVRAFLKGLFQGPQRDESLRLRLARRRPGSLHRILSRFDPEAAARIHPNDNNKLMRALEVYLIARKPITTLFHERETEPLTGYRVFQLGLNPPREQLAVRINRRCAAMFEDGLIEEVQRVLNLGYKRDSKALASIGYREAILHLSGELTLQQAIEQTQAATRQYAKRQRTWFRNDPDIRWFESFGDEKKLADRIVHHLKVDIRFI